MTFCWAADSKRIIACKVHFSKRCQGRGKRLNQKNYAGRLTHFETSASTWRVLKAFAFRPFLTIIYPHLAVVQLVPTVVISAAASDSRARDLKSFGMADFSSLSLPFNRYQTWRNMFLSTAAPETNSQPQARHSELSHWTLEHTDRQEPQLRSVQFRFVWNKNKVRASGVDLYNRVRFVEGGD